MFMALDVGARRIGVALASSVARLPYPLATLEVGEDIHNEIQKLINQHQVEQLIIGLPRNLRSEETDQTRSVRMFAEGIEALLPSLHIVWQDEALTSRKAEDELRSRKKPYVKGEIDALAATYILEDYLSDNPVRKLA